MKFSLNSWLNRFRVVAFLEGVSYLLLVFVAMPVKYFMEVPEAVKIPGMIHGFLFVLYCLLLLMVHSENNWTLKKTFLSFLVSLVPFGTFYADKHWWQEQQNKI